MILFTLKSLILLDQYRLKAEELRISLGTIKRRLGQGARTIRTARAKVTTQLVERREVLKSSLTPILSKRESSLK